MAAFIQLKGYGNKQKNVPLEYNECQDSVGVDGSVGLAARSSPRHARVDRELSDDDNDLHRRPSMWRGYIYMYPLISTVNTGNRRRYTTGVVESIPYHTYERDHTAVGAVACGLSPADRPAPRVHAPCTPVHHAAEGRPVHQRTRVRACQASALYISTLPLSSVFYILLYIL